MKKFLLIVVTSCLLISCEKFSLDYNKNENPFFRTQWTAIEEDGTILKNSNIILDFDLYSDKSMTLVYVNDNFTVQSYKTVRVSEETWVIENYRYNDTYCRFVIHMMDYFSGKNYIEVYIYNPSNFCIKTNSFVRNSQIVDIHNYILQEL